MTSATLPSASASANNCPAMRPRLAPSAVRTTSSLWRVAARANISSATLAHTSITSITKKRLNARRMFGPSSGRATRLARTAGPRAGCARAYRGIAPTRAGRAPRAPPAPPRTRCPVRAGRTHTPTDPVVWPNCKSERRSGTQRLWNRGNPNPSGMTPTTVRVASPTCTVRPTTPGSPAKRDCQTSCPMTTTG